MDLELETRQSAPRGAPEAALTLLDSHALIWLHTGNRRSRALERVSGKLYVSPASLLEIQGLVELGRVRLKRASSVSQLANDQRILLDDPPAAAWFDRALAHGWTHDPFDRLIVAHAELRNWRLATADEELLERLGPSRTFPL